MLDSGSVASKICHRHNLARNPVDKIELPVLFPSANQHPKCEDTIIHCYPKHLDKNSSRCGKENV